MMRHTDVWRAIDTLAAETGVSASGLARRAGLDPTTFNPSKRMMPDGRARWPSTESLAKVLQTSGKSLTEFADLVGGSRVLASVHQESRTIPLIGMAQAGSDGFFGDAGYPVGGGWDSIAIPDVSDPQAYALEISGASMEPVFRDGDIIVVSPQAAIRRGDRVVVRVRSGQVMAKHLTRQTARRIELRSYNPDYENYLLDRTEITWMHRIIWATQ